MGVLAVGCLGYRASDPGLWHELAEGCVSTGAKER